MDRTHRPNGGRQDPEDAAVRKLNEEHRDQGRPFKRYKDTLKANLKSCNIGVNSWEATACDGALWTYQCTQGTKDFEVNREAAILAKKERRKQRSASVDSFSCSICGRLCASGIVFHSHMRTYPASRGPSIFLDKSTYLGRSKGLCSQGNENPPRQLSLPTHLSYRQENP